MQGDPDALKLADELERRARDVSPLKPGELMLRAAAMLRRPPSAPEGVEPAGSRASHP